MKTFKITTKIKPGIPNIPVHSIVHQFNPIWKANDAPTILTTYIKPDPIREFTTNFNIFFIGSIKILPMIIIAMIHPIYKNKE